LPKRLLIAIDGPSSAGKSTVARMLAARLGYCYIESGAMYRALALLALETGTSLDDGAALAKLASGADMSFEWRDSQNRILLDGRDVTEAIRTPEVTDASSQVSIHADVRREMVRRQRELGRDGGVVMEGRDIGTKVFPQADIKIFLDASLEVRSQRRFLDQDARGHEDPAAVLRELAERDRRDREREQSPLVRAADAVRLDSTHLNAEEVVQTILKMVEEKQAASDESEVIKGKTQGE
jgi:cytidylate kinase